MSNERNGLPWALARAKYVPLTGTAEDVQEWRAKRVARRKPSTFKDYCAAHGRCIRCESTGIVLDELQGGFRSAGSYEGAKLFESCTACDGTGLESYLPSGKRKVEEVDPNCSDKEDARTNQREG